VCPGTFAAGRARLCSNSDGGRVAVVNYTELPVACGITTIAGMAHRYVRVYGLDGATLASDGATLRLPPHGLLIVE
jgi:hypothetical protein